MTAKIVDFPSAPGLAESIEMAEGLRADLRSGKIVAFAAIGIAHDDTIYAYQGNATNVTNLRMIGAVEWLKRALMDSDE